MSLYSVESGLQSLFKKIVKLHKRIDPNIQSNFYFERLRSFTQPELLIEDILFVFDSFAEKMEHIVTEKSVSAQRCDKLERVLESNDSLIRRHAKTQQQSTGKRDLCHDIWDKPKVHVSQKLSLDLKDKELKQRDLNLLKKPSNLAKSKAAYATGIDFHRMSAKAKVYTREGYIQNSIEQTEPSQQFNPFEDLKIYQRTKIEAERVLHKSMTLRDGKSRRNSKVTAITLIKNSLKVW